MRAFICFLNTMILSQCMLGQFILEPQWVKQVGSIETGSAEAWAIDVDSDGNVFWPVNLESIGNHSPWI